VELYVKGHQAGDSFRDLLEQKDAIEDELGGELEWKKRYSKYIIAMNLMDVDSENELDWPRQHEWLATKINEFHEVFVHRVRELK